MTEAQAQPGGEFGVRAPALPPETDFGERATPFGTQHSGRR